MDIVNEDGSYIKTCSHPDCFEYLDFNGPIRSWREARRVAGIAQFNRNNDCSRYKRKFWKFWICNDQINEHVGNFEF